MLLIKSESRPHQVIPTHEVIAAVLIMKRGQDAACIRWIQPILVIFGCLPKTPQTCIHGKITGGPLTGLLRIWVAGISP